MDVLSGSHLPELSRSRSTAGWATLEQPHIKYRQHRAAHSHPNRAVQHSPFGPLVVLSTVGVHQIFGSLLAPKDRSTEQRSPMHQWRERTTLGHNPTYIRKTKT